MQRVVTAAITMVMVLAALISIPDTSYAQQASTAKAGVSQQSGGNVQTELEQAWTEGWNAGSSRSGTAVMLSSMGYSLVIPGLGFASLLGGKSEVQPTLAEQAAVEGKSPAYKSSYFNGYNDGANSTRRRNVIIGSAIGTVGTFLMYSVLLGG